MKKIILISLIIFLFFVAVTEEGRNLADKIIELIVYAYNWLSYQFWNIIGKIRS